MRNAFNRETTCRIQGSPYFWSRPLPPLSFSFWNLSDSECLRRALQPEGPATTVLLRFVVLKRYTKNALLEFLLSNVQISVSNPFWILRYCAKFLFDQDAANARIQGELQGKLPFLFFNLSLIRLRSDRSFYPPPIVITVSIHLKNYNYVIQRWNPTCLKTSAMMRSEFSAAPLLTRPPSKMLSTRWVYFCLRFWFYFCFCQLCRWTKKRSVRWRQGSRASGSRQARHVLHISQIEEKDKKSWIQPAKYAKKYH